MRICLLIAAVALCACVPKGGPKAVDKVPGPVVARTEPVPRDSARPISTPVPASPDATPPLRERLPPTRPSLEAVLAGTNSRLEDAFFDYDRSDPGPDALAALQRDANLISQVLADFPNVTLTVEGHCDERGSAEYNLALGDRRATRAAGILQRFGVPAAATTPVSFGKEAPQCVESNEACWKRNRRAHLTLRMPRLPSE